MIFKKVIRRLFSVPCCECKEVNVLIWKRRCAFCDIGEGMVK